MRIAAVLASFVVASAMPASAGPLAELHYLVGRWTCTYRAGALLLPYRATYAYDLGGQTLRETATFAGGGDEELLAYAKRGWTAVVFDGSGSTTIMRGTGSANHIAFRSIYPDASIAESVDRVSATEYTIHATVRAGGKTTASVDTCLRR